MHDRPLHQAVTRHEAQSVIQKLKATHPSIEKLKETNDKGLTLLQLAAREGEIDLVLLLISHNAGVDQVQDFKHHNPYVVGQAKATAMQLAAERGHRLVAEILLISGASKEKVLKEATKSGNKFLASMVQGLRPRESTLSYMLFWAVENYAVTANASRIFTQLAPYFKEKNLTQTQEGEVKEVKRSTSRAIAMSLETKEVAPVMSNSNFQNIVSGMIQLVAREGKPYIAQIIKELLRLAPERFDDARHMTAGYWAAMNNNYDLFAYLCKTNEEVAALTFYQLHLYAPEKFVSYEGMMSASPGIDSKFLKLRRTRSNSYRELDDNSLMAYEALARGKSQSIRVDKELQGRSAVVRHAMKQFNFVVLVEISKLYDFDGFVPFLQNQDDTFAAFYLARKPRDSFQILQTFAEKKSLDDWLRFASTRAGLMQQLMSRDLWFKSKSEKSAAILASVGPAISQDALQREKESVALRCIADYYTQEPRIAALLSFDRSLSECISDVVNKEFTPSNRVKDQKAAEQQALTRLKDYYRDVVKPLYQSFPKLGVSISTIFDKDEESYAHVFLPDNVWKTNFKFLGPYDQLKLSQVSKRMHGLFSGGVIQSNEMIRLRGLVNAIDRMRDEVDRYARRRGCLSNRVRDGFGVEHFCVWLSFLVFAGLVGVASYEFQDWKDVHDNLRSQMDHLRPLANPFLWPRNRTSSCTQLSFPTDQDSCDQAFMRGLNITTDMTMCLSLCEQLVSNDPRRNWTIGVVFGAVFSFVMLCAACGWTFGGWKTGPARFQQDPLSNYPQIVRDEIRNVQREAKALGREVFNEVTDLTTLDAFLIMADNERGRLEGKLNSLRHIKIEEVFGSKGSEAVKPVTEVKSTKVIKKQPKLQEQEMLLEEGMLKRSRYGSMNPSY